MQWLIPLLWILTILIPINGLMLFGIRNERRRVRIAILEYWRLRQRRKDF